MYGLLKIKKIIFTSFFIPSVLMIIFQTGCSLSHADNHKVLPTAGPGQSRDEQIKKAVKLVNQGEYDESERIILALAADDLWRNRADILLGRIYTEQGFLDKAGFHLDRAVSDKFILRDYALDMLAGVYLSEKKYEKAIKAAEKEGVPPIPPPSLDKEDSG